MYPIDEMAKQWTKIGTLLGFSDAVFDTLLSDPICNGDAAKCCRKLLSRWLNGYNTDSRPKTWQTLLEVLRDARLGELADELEDILTHTS